MGLFKISLHEAAVRAARVSGDVSPPHSGALIKRGAGIDTLSHAVRVNLGEVSGVASAAVVDAAEAEEALRGPWNLVNGIIGGGAVRVDVWSGCRAE